MSELYIGLMSGTSADAIDAALVDLETHPRLLDHFSLPLPENLRSRLTQLQTPMSGELDLAGELDWQLGELFADAALALLEKSSFSAADIRAIGSHGQTIRHRPPSAGIRGFSWQIGDPNLIAQKTGITTVADFRRRDMALGGQGAPLVPAFHKALFHSPEKDRILINIGGIANITWLGRNGEVRGFDTGPGNCLMDSWVLQHQRRAYDDDGRWANQGSVNHALLAKLLSYSYFSLKAPKSTGREEFNLQWLEEYLQASPPLAPQDVQASLLELTAGSISEAIKPILIATNTEIYVCGGGAYNSRLIQRLQEMLTGNQVSTTQELGLAPDWIEAMAFAWLAQQTLEGKPGNLCKVTGASEQTILGGIFPGSSGSAAWAQKLK